MAADTRGNATAERESDGELKPGEHLRAEIERLGLDQVAVSQAVGVSRQSINNIVNGRQSISRAMAGKLGRLTGRSPDYWLRASFPRTANLAAADERPHGFGILVNHQIVRAVTSGIIRIDPFDEAHVQPASVELTLDDCASTAEGEQLDIGGADPFVLKSGRTVNVSTREQLEFPQDYIGRIGAVESLAGNGILILHGLHIGPGFRGRLQFSVFNAGFDDFEMRGGEAIVAIEIIPLAATPAYNIGDTSETQHARGRDAVVSMSCNEICERMIRDAVREKTQIDIGKGGATARIAELTIEILDRSADAALDAAVRAALGGLKTLRQKRSGAQKDRERYHAFFATIGERLYLTGEQTRCALAVLALPVDAGDTLIAALRDGSEVVVPLPTRSARVSLRQLARQLHEDPLDLILMLAGAVPYRRGE